MHHNHTTLLTTAAVVAATALTGCNIFEDSPQEQLDAILAVTGDQIFSIEVTAGGKGPGAVAVGATHDGDTGNWSYPNGKVVNDSPTDPPAGTLANVDAFPPLDTLIELAKTTIEEEDDCSQVDAHAAVTPSGGIATWMECGFNQIHINARSTLDGQPFTIPAVDLTTTQGITALDQALTKLLGNSQLVKLQYDFHKPHIPITAAQTTNTQGQPCHPYIAAMVTQPTNPFPIHCQNTDTEQPSFNTAEYGQTIIDIITTIQNSPDIDQDSLTAITFTTDGTNLIWDANTSNLSDLMNHRNILKGTTPKH